MVRDAAGRSECGFEASRRGSRQGGDVLTLLALSEVLDPSAFKEDGGPSMAERIARGSGGKVWFRHADNTRVPARGAMGGWDQMRSRLVGDGDGRPMMLTFSSCVDSIRTIPFL
jgi:hypothetical protein